jgi:hypothetical protein
VKTIPAGSYKVLIIARDNPQPLEEQEQNKDRPVISFGTSQIQEDLYDKFLGDRISIIRNKSGVYGEGQVVANYYLTAYDISNLEFLIE